MRAFISYARADEGRFDDLLAELGQLCDSVWTDRRLRGGQDWWDEILSQIEHCDVFVLAASPASLRSEACRSEASYAIDLGKPILPIRIAPVDHREVPSNLRYQMTTYDADA